MPEQSTSVVGCRRNMQKTMQDHAAVYRTQATLAEGVTKIDQVGVASTPPKDGRQ